MNTSRRSTTVFIIMVVFFIFSIETFAQTARSLTFTCSTNAPSGTWGTKHVLAIWIEDTQNPSNGIVTLDFKDPIQSAKVTVENESGVTIYSNNLENDFIGNLNLDLTVFAKGIYFVKVTTKENKFVYKLLLAE